MYDICYIIAAIRQHLVYNYNNKVLCHFQSGQVVEVTLNQF